MKLIIRDVEQAMWGRASKLAESYLREFPERMGFHQLCVYMVDGKSYAVYRTKTSVVVRGV